MTHWSAKRPSHALRTCFALSNDICPISRFCACALWVGLVMKIDFGALALLEPDWFGRAGCVRGKASSWSCDVEGTGRSAMAVSKLAKAKGSSEGETVDEVGGGADKEARKASKSVAICAPVDAGVELAAAAASEVAILPSRRGCGGGDDEELRCAGRPGWASGSVGQGSR